jgi:hypothetical protein
MGQALEPPGGQRPGEIVRAAPIRRGLTLADLGTLIWPMPRNATDAWMPGSGIWRRSCRISELEQKIIDLTSQVEERIGEFMRRAPRTGR